MSDHSFPDVEALLGGETPGREGTKKQRQKEIKKLTKTKQEESKASKAKTTNETTRH